MLGRGLEPPSLAGRAPKARAYTNSATPAFCFLTLFDCNRIYHIAPQRDILSHAGDCQKKPPRSSVYFLYMRLRASLVTVGLFFVAALYPLSVGASFDRNLYYGLSGDQDVVVLQSFLSELGLYTGPLSGNYFSLTQKAVVDFQTQEGIDPATGYFGLKSRALANQLLAAQGSSSPPVGMNSGTSTDASNAPASVSGAASAAVDPTSRINELASTTDALTQQLGDLSTRYDTLEALVGTLSASLDSVNVQLSLFQSSINSLQDSLSALLNAPQPSSQQAPTATMTTSVPSSLGTASSTSGHATITAATSSSSSKTSTTTTTTTTSSSGASGPSTSKTTAASPAPVPAPAPVPVPAPAPAPVPAVSTSHTTTTTTKK